MRRKWIPLIFLALFLTQIVAPFNVIKEVNASHSSNQNAIITRDAHALKEDLAAVVLSSGDFPQHDRESEVYGGTGAGGRFVAHKFRVPEDLVGFQIQWYGYKIGAPTDLILELYEDVDDRPSPLGAPIEIITQPAVDVGSVAGWQAAVAFSSTLIANKFYWIVFQIAGGDDANKYVVAARGRKLDETLVLGGNDGYAGTWSYRGISILWIRDLAGMDKKIYPCQNTFVYWSGTSQDFIAPKDMAFNTIFFYLSDRDYTESTTQLRVIRISDGETLATATFNKNVTSGLEWWLPVPLDRTVHCSASESYRIEVPATAFAQEASPAKAGFQGQSRYVLFKLGLMNLTVKNFDIMDITTTGMDAVSNSVWMAVRFRTSLEGTLESVEVKTAQKKGSADFMASLREDDGTGKAPAGVDLETVTIPAGETPSSGWVNFAGLTVSLSSNTYYWIVFKAGSGGSYVLCRLVDPYKFMVRVSRDGGATWSRAGEGPTEIPFRITTSTEIIEQGVEDVPRGEISTTTWVAQSFSPPSNILAKGALVLVGKKNVYEDYDIEVTLRKDSGSDTPSSDILATGILSYTKFLGIAVYHVDFDVPYPIKVNAKYWIVIRTMKGGAYYKTAVYRDPVGSFGGTTHKAKVSTDEGATWTPIGESDMIFAIAEYIPFEEPILPFNATIPTYYLSSYQGLDCVKYLVPSPTYENFCKVIEEHLLPMGMRRFHVPLQETYNEPVEAWLTACDEYGIENWLEFPGWGYVWAYPTEVRGSAHPEAMSYDRTGESQPDYGCVIDWFDIMYPFYRDWLKQMLDWYGEHTSLVAIGSQPGTDHPVYGGRGGAPDYGYNPESIRRFTETDYYRRDVNASGYHKDGTKCRLWEHFIEKSVTYTLADLIADIDEYHDAPVTDHPLRGYIAYLNVANAKLMKALYDYTVSYTGKQWVLKHPFLFSLWVSVDAGLLDIPTYTRCNAGWYPENMGPAVYKMLEWKFKGLPGSNMGHPKCNPYRVPTEEEKLNVYLGILPTLSHESLIMEINWRYDYLADLSFTETYRRFGDVLNRMRAYGGWFGEARGIKALVIGELEVGLGPQYLSPVFDLAMTHGEFEETNLTRFGDFSAFNLLLIWGAGRPSPNTLTVEAQERIKSFIYNGGGVVCVTLPSWLADVLGTGTPIGYDHPVMQPFTSGAPTVTEYSYGAGRVLKVPAPTRVEWIERGSDWWIVLTNALLYASKREDLSPAWYYGSGAFTETRAWSPDVYYSICGAPGKVLVWLSNRGNITRNMEMHLNSDFYGIDPNGWIAIDVSNWAVVAKGTGTDIEIDATIPPESWMPIYIMNTTSNLQDLYSNIFIKDKSITSNKATYTLQGPYNQTSWLIVNSTTIPSSVTANNTGTLPQHTSLSTLNHTTTPNGWFHDPTNIILYIKFKPTSTVKIEITQPTGPTPTHTLSIDSSPITGVPFTLDGVSQATPFSTTLDEGTHTVTMPKSTDIGGTSYDFKNWEDGSTNPTRSIDLITDMTITAYYEATSPSYTLASLPLPFVSESSSVSDTFIIIPISDPHGPSGPAHTMDTMGGVLIACRLGLEATGGIVKTAMDTYSYISTYDYATAKVTMTDMTSHLIVLGSPGVNQVAYYYNELKDINGKRVMPVLFLRDAVGDYLYVQSSGGEYRIGPDAQGQMAEYGVIQLYRDGDRYVMLVYGLGGESTKAAAKTVAEFDQWGLTGTAVIVKYYDSDGDGYLDTTEIVEPVDLSSSTSSSSLYSIQSTYFAPILVLTLLFPILYYKRKNGFKWTRVSR